jgi:UDP-N-acetylmuramate dehydrogenase
VEIDLYIEQNLVTFAANIFNSMLKKNFSLLNYNSFGVDAIAENFFEFTNISEFVYFLSENKIQTNDILVLGKGCNVLFTKSFTGFIIHPKNKGIELVREDENSVELKVEAGEDWDEFVEFTVNNDWCGLENLSLIPGSVGAAPVQNIGAYGVEVKDFILSVECVEIETGNKFSLSNRECLFEYRDSIFKNSLKNKCVIVSVIFKLSKFPNYNIEYKDVKSKLENAKEINIKTIRKAICEIRNHKLPDPLEIGNVGSFFKNPVISSADYHLLLAKFSDIVAYKINNDSFKLAAGWLIDNCGWKGYVENGVGVHDKQALVLVNKGTKFGNNVLNLAQKIRTSVLNKFGIFLEFEVNIL